MVICPGAEPCGGLAMDPSFSDVDPFRMPLAG